jgi:TatD DNase family protein
MHDSHTHLSLSPIKENLKRIIDGFKRENGKYILDMGTDPDDWFTVLETHSKEEYSGIVFSGLGIHPTIFSENYHSLEEGIDIYKFEKKLEDKLESLYRDNFKKLTAVGETGLDYFEMYKENFKEDEIEVFKEVQKKSFRKQCQLAIQYNLPMSIHARELKGQSLCVEDILKILAEEGRGNIKGVFHSYTGEQSGLEKILDMGFYVGFNSIITYPSGENVRELLKNTPLDRILFETDGPFLPTQKTRKNKKSEFPFGKPSDVKEIMETASEIKEISTERLEKESDENFEKLFYIPLN